MSNTSRKDMGVRLLKALFKYGGQLSEGTLSAYVKERLAPGLRRGTGGTGKVWPCGGLAFWPRKDATGLSHEARQRRGEGRAAG